MMHGAGKTLSIDERLHLCIGVAGAISEMHARDIIHGDISPQNVLVFQDSSKVFFARVTDFGYSTIYTKPGDIIQMAKSSHWVAPEWHHRGFLPAQAKKMDVYSLGLLILWILCCNTSQSIEPQSQVIVTASSDDALTFAEENLRFMQPRHRAGFKEFFQTSLNRNATDRSDVRHLQEILLGEKDSKPLGSRIALDGLYPEGISKDDFDEQHTVACTREDIREGFVMNHDMFNLIERHPGFNAFQLIPSMHQLYRGDYRVRIYVANCLNDAASAFEKTSESASSFDDILVQTALCFEIGFGVARDQRKSYNLIQGRESNEVELARRLKYLCENGVKRHFSNGIYRWGEMEGCVQYIDLFSTCRGKTGWERVQGEYRGEITNGSQALGPENVLVLLLKVQMTRGYTKFGR